MSKEVNRNQVFQTTRVRTTLKNDGSWIQKSKQEMEEQDKARTDQAVETRTALQKSYVLSTAKKFESEDSSLSPSLENSQFVPSEGDSTNQANVEVIPPQKDAQPEGSTVETTDDTKPQAPTEELIQNGETQPEESVADTKAENKGEHADTTVDQSNVGHNEGTAEVSADVHVEEHIQNGETPVPSTKENPVAVSPVQPAAQPVANTTAENKEEHADTTVEQSSVERVSADTHVEDPVAETSAAAGTEESKDTAEVPAALAVELKPQEEPSTETEPANETNVEEAGIESTVQSAEGSCEKSPPEQTAEKTVEAVAEVVVESSPDKSDVINATPGEEAALQDSVEPVPDLLAESVSESFTQPAADTTVKSVECNVKPAVSTESVLQTRAEEVIECPVQPIDSTVVEQSVEPTPEIAADRGVELNIEDALEPVTASDAEAAVDTLANRAIELTDALDVEPPTAEAAPEPLKDPKKSHTEEKKLNQQPDQTNIPEMFQKPAGNLQSTQTLNVTGVGNAVCSFCDKVIDGNVKITFNEPLVYSHPDCLKCGVCAKALGDMLTPMFCHDQVIQCGGCFAIALKI